MPNSFDPKPSRVDTVDTVDSTLRYFTGTFPGSADAVFTHEERDAILEEVKRLYETAIRSVDAALDDFLEGWVDEVYDFEEARQKEAHDHERTPLIDHNALDALSGRVFDTHLHRARYPYIAIQPRYFQRRDEIDPDRNLRSDTWVGTDLTRPELFAEHIGRGLKLLLNGGKETADEHIQKEARVEALKLYVGQSRTWIPLRFAVAEEEQNERIDRAVRRGAERVGLDDDQLALAVLACRRDITNAFPAPKLIDIDDRVVDGSFKARHIARDGYRILPSTVEKRMREADRTFRENANAAPMPDSQRKPTEEVNKPLAPFSAIRVDYSLARLDHYTGGTGSHVQDFVLFTNYPDYVQKFVASVYRHVRKGHGKLVLPATERGRAPHEICKRDGERLPTPGALARLVARATGQMPAFHYVPHCRNGNGGEDFQPGVSLVNIGVGPSNAKTMTDLLAVFRPLCWLMIGHCGGLRMTQELGAYVLAQAYVRDDHVLDRNVPPYVPIPQIAEVHEALEKAIDAQITEDTGLRSDARDPDERSKFEHAFRRRVRTGTVVTTDDRNWELRPYPEVIEMFENSRAIAVDMESATIAANGLRYRVPYGTLLCVSDKPLVGEVKMRGAANRFYQEATQGHLEIALRTTRLLWRDRDRLRQSRKLNGLDDPIFP